ncbi:hypothetical protein [Microbulbifer aggregans]|uniref:hypothetical protein n=1 Tax=Microbulbifer aggregans TaxID=1769779 RepID=UPI001CFD173B|nr:hypothetical protein [Microbulbifer aggregans]
MSFYKPIVAALLATCALLFFWVWANSDSAGESKNANSVYSSMLGEIPKKYISYGPERSEPDPNIWRSSIEFDSRDVSGYSGELFSVKVFFTYNENSSIEGSCLSRKINFLRNSDRYLEEEPRKYHFDSSSGRGYIILIARFKGVGRNKQYYDLISQDGKDVALYKNLYPGNSEKMLPSIDDFLSVAPAQICAEYQIKYLAGNRSSIQYFLISKEFLDGFYR